MISAASCACVPCMFFIVWFNATLSLLLWWL